MRTTGTHENEQKNNILTYSGIVMNPLHPQKEDLKIRDIAHALSMIARANGHFHSLHSVASHSMECADEAASRGLDTDMVLFCLLHDGAEAYLGDFVSPVKHQMREYNDAEDRMLQIIYEVFVGKTPTKEQWKIIKEIDHTLLYYEFQTLMGRSLHNQPVSPLKSKPDFSEKYWKDVEKDFLEMYDRLKKKQCADNRIRGIVFDVDDTLYSQRDSFTDACQKFFGDDLNVPEKELYEAYYKTYNRKDPGSGGQGSTHSLAPSYLQQLRIREAMAVFGVEVSEEEAIEFQKVYYDNQMHRSVSDTIAQMLSECAKRYKIGIISNGNSEYQRKKMRSMELDRWFKEEDILVSGDVRIDKPDRRIFEIAQEHFGIPVENLLYVGDSLNNDVRGAGKAGWMTVWMNRNERVREQDDPVPDYEVTTEKELRDLLLSIE